jgi:hypothetical protein
MSDRFHIKKICHLSIALTQRNVAIQTPKTDLHRYKETPKGKYLTNYHEIRFIVYSVIRDE